jgi:hypothetical protein
MRRYHRTFSRAGATALIIIMALSAVFLAAPAAGSQLATPVASPAGGTHDPVIMAVGDIACGSETPSTAGCQQRQTSDLVLQAHPDAVLALGDNQYECGQLADFERSFDPTWGRFKALIHPAVGNHEYQVTNTADGRCNGAPRGAPGYWSYFGDAASPLQPGCRSYCDGYYSYDIGAWHMIVLNTNCSPVGGCDSGSRQGQWLAADLAAHPAACTLVYMHHPRFSSGHHGDQDQSAAFWQMMYQAGVDVVLAGHDHDYERFAPQTPLGAPDGTYGIREFVVGTGGKNLTEPGSAGPLPTSEVFQHSTFGVLRLTLHADSYDWNFVPVPGEPPFTDSGSGTCHSAPPAAMAAVALGSPVATPVASPAPASTVLFADDFEQGSLVKWDSNNGLAIGASDGGGGRFAAHATATGKAAYAATKLAAPANDLTVSLRFEVVAKDKDSVNLLKLRTAGDDSVLGVYLSNTGKLAYRSDISDDTVVSHFDIAPKKWHTLEMTVHVAGAKSLISINVDGALVAGLNGPVSLGQTPIGRIQLGENVAGQTFDMIFDDLVVTGQPVPGLAATPVATPAAAATPQR